MGTLSFQACRKIASDGLLLHAHEGTMAQGQPMEVSHGRAWPASAEPAKQAPSQAPTCRTHIPRRYDWSDAGAGTTVCTEEFSSLIRSTRPRAAGRGRVSADE